VFGAVSNCYLDAGGRVFNGMRGRQDLSAGAFGMTSSTIANRTTRAVSPHARRHSKTAIIRSAPYNEKVLVAEFQK
jgi:hypothetical protein